MSVVTLIPFGAGAFALLVYAISLAPGITWAGGSADSGELAMAAYHHGVAHPTGYPTWVTLAWLFTHLPFGNVAYRVNLLSAVSAALAVGLMALLIVREGQGEGSPARRPLYRLAPALAGSLLLAFSPMFWSQAVVTEVYALNAFFLVLVLVLHYQSLISARGVVGDLPAGGRRWTAATGFALGIGAANHLTLLLLLPGLVIGYLANARKSPPSILVSTQRPRRTQSSGLETRESPRNSPRSLPDRPFDGAQGTVPFEGLKERPEPVEGVRATAGYLLPTAYCLLPTLALGLSVYLLLPLRAATAPPFANWGDPSSPDAFVAHITGAAYRGALFSLPADLVLSKVPALARMVLDQFGWPGYGLALLGVWSMARGARSLSPVEGPGPGTDSRALLLTWTVTAFLYVFFALNYPVLDSQVYLLPFFVLLALAIGWGAAWLVEATLPVRGDSQAGVPVLQAARGKLGGRRRREQRRRRRGSPLTGRSACATGEGARAKIPATMLLTLLLLLIAGAVLSSLPKTNRAGDWEAYTWAQETLGALPQGAILVAAEDRHTFSLWYLQYVEARRPDVALIDARLVDWPWYRRNLAATYPDLRVPEPGVSTLGLLATLSQANARWPVLFTFEPPGVETQPEGTLFRAVGG